MQVLRFPAEVVQYKQRPAGCLLVFIVAIWSALSVWMVYPIYFGCLFSFFANQRTWIIIKKYGYFRKCTQNQVVRYQQEDISMAF